VGLFNLGKCNDCGGVNFCINTFLEQYIYKVHRGHTYWNPKRHILPVSLFLWTALFGLQPPCDYGQWVMNEADKMKVGFCGVCYNRQHPYLSSVTILFYHSKCSLIKGVFKCDPSVFGQVHFGQVYLLRYASFTHMIHYYHTLLRSKPITHQHC